MSKNTMKQRRPLIGITCSRTTGGAWGIYSLGHFIEYTYAEYSQAILDAEGAPLIVPLSQDKTSLESILSSLQGLILSGGPDLHPRTYGEEPMARLDDVDDALDRFELQVARLALEKDLPLLAICRGIQVLNVSLGGTLYQDIASQVPESICHTPKVDKAVNTHAVQIEPKTRLSSIFEKKRIWVNGKHHQAVKEPAPGLTVCARAKDGVIEAVEDGERKFALGVQWHPEGTWRHDPYSRKLFRALVQAARTSG
ncbi:MAG: gamma-glutamyl-gamma-aminobutyrate hydrolase family protein [Desulfobacterota bacterium]|jgi:putative glutamine amidotransferase|nr:gamma-glutamyl-gamma-aminobutyrate hydrolase family protein [Thermodesulfobacteriota bacterium]